MVDAIVLAVALSFIAWELIIRTGVGDPARFSLSSQLAMLIYPLTDIAVASMLGLMLLIGRSPARVGLFIGATCRRPLPTSPTRRRSVRRPTRRRSPCRGRAGRWASDSSRSPPVCPAGASSGTPDPTMSRLLVVHVPVMVAVWLAAWRYMVRDCSSDHRHDRDRCVRGIVDHRRAVGDVVPLLDAVGSTQRQHHATCATPRPNSVRCSTTSPTR